MYICLTIFFATFLALFTASLFQDKQTSKQRNFRANQKKKHFSGDLEEAKDELVG